MPTRDEISTYHLHDETRLVGALIERAVYTEDERRRIGEHARRLVEAARADRRRHGGLDAFLAEYGLTSEEGVILLCLAEALLRIPDTQTADALIAEKMAGGQWERHLGASDSLFVNASTFGLMLTGKVVRLKDARGMNPLNLVKRMVARSGEPVIRQALRQAMKILGDQFVLGRTIGEAIDRARSYERRGYRFSYDMLGEAARTARDAERYFSRYVTAIEAVGKAAGPLASLHGDALMARPGLSVKLSAVHPRFEPGKEERLQRELVPRLRDLARRAREAGLPLTVDAEEQDRLDLTLDAFAEVFLDPVLDGWPGLGVVVQAYGRRAIPVLRWLKRLSDVSGKRIPVRLVKGAYWDSEIKWAQERGWTDYPVFTRKLHTDVSYLAAMRFLLSDPVAFFPQFATHNAHSISSGLIAGGNRTFEFQRLHGMGEALYEAVVGDGTAGRVCRIYAPVGGHEDLLAYLVRRLLENGANTSFVNRLADEDTTAAEMVVDPVEAAEREWQSGQLGAERTLPKPTELFEPRLNSVGLPLSEPRVRADAEKAIARELEVQIAAGPIVDGKVTAGGDEARLALCPHDRRQRVGTVREATPEDIERSIAASLKAAHAWDRRGGHERAKILEAAADLYERNRMRLMAVIVREAGKTLENAQADIREAVDFLRYYAAEARRLFAGPVPLPGPTGERNTLELRARGPIAAIAPWNFP
ncbi:MAG TPA: bifunctional proline dehydrogenase/L-glutamate gamma-semialdehyde dehydrogenase PutA, partial [Hyphomicrobiaceae bacterium]|nr:bifunctional proline dehydrogenase/L-glutamate gamma-semialdehyde dehydrogenase PutA [Hyphomicrobiaceae bacterium]